MFTRVVAFAVLGLKFMGANADGAGSWQYDPTPDTNLPCSSSNLCGPSEWYLVEDGEACDDDEQSPINLVGATVNLALNDLAPTAVNSGCSSWTSAANNNAYGASFTGSCTNLYVTIDGIKYYMLQFHFHSPSEHTIGGGYADAEIHFVHQAATADGAGYAVVGVMLYAAAGSIGGSRNVFLRNLWDGAINEKYGISSSTYVTAANISDAIVDSYNVTGVALNPYADMLPSSRDYFRYDGSFTTYPCTEGVKWHVMTDPVFISSEDLAIIRAAYGNQVGTIVDENGNDARPVQPLGTRTLYQFSAAASA